ncbi:MAG: phosphatidate cytidylyltransferase [Sphingomonadales bacterium]|jgi:phosphatidate cytidylyltransferase|nr:phosphatidate cytidylyltransferase [Sphingomonadales bacterium]
MSLPSTPAPSPDLLTRFATGVALIAVALVAIYLGGWPFRLLVAAGAAAMMIEWGDMHKVRRAWTWLGAVLLAAPTLALPEYLFPAADRDPAEISPELFDQIWIGFAAILALGLVYTLISRRVALGWGFLYIALPSFALLVLSWAWFELVFWLMLVTWATDIFAYFAGRSIGGPKLAPRISPNKTWAGLIGGMAGAALVGAAAAWLLGIGEPFLWLGAPMGLLAQLGDLYESGVKRRRGVKDSGTLLPGHGGVLDRLDGLLPVIVATLLVLIASLA